VDTLTHSYQRSLRFYADWNNQDVLSEYLTALAHVYDPHSDYFNNEQSQQFAISMKPSRCSASVRSLNSTTAIARSVGSCPAARRAKDKQLKSGDPHCGRGAK